MQGIGGDGTLEVVADAEVAIVAGAEVQRTLGVWGEAAGPPSTACPGSGTSRRLPP